MLFISLPQLSNKYKRVLWNIFSRCHRSMIYENKEVVRSKNVFIDSVEHKNWIYNNLIEPLKIPRNHIKNKYHYKEHYCCGINFNVFRPGDWSHPHCDLNPTKIHFLLQGERRHTLFFVDENIHWCYSSPVIINVSKKHTVTQLEKLTSMRIMLQIFLIEKIEYYAELLKRRV